MGLMFAMTWLILVDLSLKLIVLEDSLLTAITIFLREI